LETILNGVTGITIEAWIPDTLRSFQSLTRSGMTVYIVHVRQAST